MHRRLRLLTFPPRTTRPNRAYGRSRDLPVPAQGASTHARVLDHAGLAGRSRLRARPFCLPSIGRILMARGRDAADVAIVTTFGPCTLAGFKVITEELTSSAPANT